MYQIYCEVCHGVLNIDESKTSAKCLTCGNTVHIPHGYTALESSFCYAMEARKRRDFKTAYSAYSEILEKDPQNTAALWGRAISTYEIEYQPVGNNEYRLVCHQSALRNFSENEDVKAAILLSEGDEEAGYIAEASRISKLQEAVSKTAAITQPYDVMVVAAETEECRKALESVRTALTASGLKVFCPYVSLSEIDIMDREPYLYHAFNSISSMVVVACGKTSFTSEICFDADRFISIKAKAAREAKENTPQLAVVFDGLDEYNDIPDNVFDGADERFSLSDTDLAQYLSEFALKARVDYGKGLRSQASESGDYDYSNLLKRARVELEGGNFENAAKLYDEVLSRDAYSGQSYWGLLLASHECANEEQLISKNKDIRQDINYKNALAFASEREQQLFKSVAEKAYEAEKRHNEQIKEQAKENELNKAKKAQIEEDISKAKKAQAQKEEKSNSLGKLIIVGIAAVLIVGGFFGYKAITGANPVGKEYNKAMDLYNHGEYIEAANIFEELGDYKDSAEMNLLSRSNYYANAYHEALSEWETPDKRSHAVSVMKGATKYVTTAEGKLNEWLEEGRACYEAGDFHGAYNVFTAFGEEYEEYYDVWRCTVNQGVVSAGGLAVAAVNRETGELYQVNCEKFGFDLQYVRSVSISPTGKSAALVDTDGKVHFYGKIADSINASWSNIINVKITDSMAAALSKDGTLYVNLSGKTSKHSDVSMYSVFDEPTGYMAVFSDGTVYCSDAEVNTAVSKWNDIVSAATNGKSAAGVTMNGEIVLYGFADGAEGRFPNDEKMVAVTYSGETYAFIGAQERQYTFKKPDGAGKAYVADNTIARISVSMDGRISKSGNLFTFNTTKDIEAEIENAFASWKNIGIPPLD